MIPKEHLCNDALHAFQHAPPVKLKHVPILKKLKNERRLKRHAERLQAALSATDDRAAIKRTVTAFLLRVDEERLLFDRPFLKFFLEKGYLEVAEQFMAQAGAEDGQLKTREVYQAMRNVWIMNSLQLYWDLPLELTPPVYAYSMLYPYTDNYLDDPAVPAADKRTFNAHVSAVLAGNPTHEDRLAGLMAMIESRYPRGEYPDVYASIRFIHEAQIASLRQHTALDAAEILRLSFMKGGASVLADAYLVKGDLTDADSRFAFRYGTFLQLLDDLQDVAEDQKDGHATLFSAKSGLLDDEVRHLLQFIHMANDPAENNFLKDVIRSCTVMMVMEAVSRQPERVSRKLYRELEAASHVRLAFYRDMLAFFESTMAQFDPETSIGSWGKSPT